MKYLLYSLLINIILLLPMSCVSTERMLEVQPPGSVRTIHDVPTPATPPEFLPHISAPEQNFQTVMAEPVIRDAVIDWGLEMLHTDPLPIAIPEGHIPLVSSPSVPETAPAEISISTEAPAVVEADRPTAAAPTPEISTPTEAKSEAKRPPNPTSVASTASTTNIEILSLPLPLSRDKTAKVTLFGRGWVFLESDTELDFRSKIRGEAEEHFLFRVAEPLKTRAIFQRQDLSSGEIEYKTMDLYFMEDDGDGNMEDDGDGDMEDDGDGNMEDDGGIVSAGAAVSAAGATVSAEARVSPRAQAQSQAGADEIPGATQGLRDTAMNMDMPAAISEMGDNTTNIDRLSAAQLEELAGQHEQAGEFLRSLEILDHLQHLYPAYQHNDRVSYTQARILEKPEVRNIRASIIHYKELLQFHPFSSYEMIAKERIRFLERNIFKIF